MVNKQSDQAQQEFFHRKNPGVSQKRIYPKGREGVPHRVKLGVKGSPWEGMQKKILPSE